MLPRGFELRNDILRVIYTAARKSVPDLVSDEDLEALVQSQRKLEVVLGRLWGTVGDDALQCLLTLRVEMPNEAHLLAALHLARGGIHVTLNFDTGIELAYRLLTGHMQLPSTTPDKYRGLLVEWQTLVPSDAPPLRVVAGHGQFTDWLSDGKPPALLKVHGSLSINQRALIDVVVVDVEELGQLTAARRAAIEALRHTDQLLITGYSGADPDVYEVLLSAAKAPRSSWHCYTLDGNSPLHQDAPAHDIDLQLGIPTGLAATALRELVGQTNGPAWPALPLPGETYRQRFDRWAVWFRDRHSAQAITQAWAWLAADLGNLDTAEAILARLTSGSDPHPNTFLRHAEVLYTRARGRDREQAATLFRRIAITPHVDSGTRHHCRLRASDIARGRATRGATDLHMLPHLARAISGPLHVLLTTRAGRRDTESAADAYRALQQTGLRALERAAGSAPKVFWPILALACRGITAFGRRAETLAANGNRRALVRQHRLLLTALAALLSSREPPQGLEKALESLHDAYVNADDMPGAGNCTATLAVVAAAQKNLQRARYHLTAAGDEYRMGRPDGMPIPSGAALHIAIDRLLRRLR